MGRENQGLSWHAELDEKCVSVSTPMSGSAFAQFIQSRSESGSELFGRAPTPVVQEDNHWSDFDHVMMYRDHVKTVLAERFQNRCYFAFEHRHIACNRGILLRARKRSPCVKPHASVDRCAVLLHF